MSPRASFADLMKSVDDVCDDHLGDDATLVVEGQRIPIRSTDAVEQIVRQTEAGESVVLQYRLALQQRLVPERLAERGATVERVDPYAPGMPTVTHKVRGVEYTRSGLVHLILGRPD